MVVLITEMRWTDQPERALTHLPNMDANDVTSFHPHLHVPCTKHGHCCPDAACLLRVIRMAGHASVHHNDNDEDKN